VTYKTVIECKDYIEKKEKLSTEEICILSKTGGKDGNTLQM